MINQVFTTDEMYNLCNGSPISCEFDFSVISMSNYQPFFKALPNFIYKKVDSLTLSIDFREKFEKSSERNIEEWKTIKNSISIQQPHFMQYITKILCIALPKTKRLHSLTIRHLHIHSAYLPSFFDSCCRSNTLKNLYFETSPVSQDSFLEFLGKISPNSFENLMFKHCKLDGNVLFPQILKFLHQDLPHSQKWTLKTFDLSENTFSDEQIILINQYLQKNFSNSFRTQISLTRSKVSRQKPIENIKKNQEIFSEEEERFEKDYDQNINKNINKNNSSSPKKHFDLKINQNSKRLSDIHETIQSTEKKLSSTISDQFISNESSFDEEEDFMFEEEDISIPEMDLSKKNDLREKYKDAINSVPKTQNLPQRKILKENAQLKEELKQLMQKLGAAQYSPDVFVIGPNSQEFVDIVKGMETSLRQAAANSAILRKSP